MWGKLEERTAVDLRRAVEEERGAEERAEEERGAEKRVEEVEVARAVARVEVARVVAKAVVAAAAVAAAKAVDAEASRVTFPSRQLLSSALLFRTFITLRLSVMFISSAFLEAQ